MVCHVGRRPRRHSDGRPHREIAGRADHEWHRPRDGRRPRRRICAPTSRSPADTSEQFDTASDALARLVCVKNAGRVSHALRAIIASGSGRCPKPLPAPLFFPAMPNGFTRLRDTRSPAIPKLLSSCVLVSTAERRHMFNMIPTEKRHTAANDHTVAVARWDDDGGAAKASHRTSRPPKRALGTGPRRRIRRKFAAKNFRLGRRVPDRMTPAARRRLASLH